MLQIVENKLLTKTVLLKEPRKKKSRRWQKKYMKKYSMQVPSDEIFMFGNIVFCHPETAKLLRWAIKKKQEAMAYNFQGLTPDFKVVDELCLT